MPVAYSCNDRIALIEIPTTKGTPQEIRKGVYEAFERFKKDDTARIAVVSSDGTDFCGDVFQNPDLDVSSTATRRELFGRWAGGHHEIWKPTIAAVQGYCYGEGATLALACDFRVGLQTTRLGFHLASLGDCPNASAAWLINLVGISKAFELLWLRESLSAEESLHLGLLNRVIDVGTVDEASQEGRLPMNPIERTVTTTDGNLVGGAIKFAEMLLLNAPLTQAFQKEIAYRSIGVPFQYAQSLEIGIHPLGSADRIEGNRAFVENRRPVWRNR